MGQENNGIYINGREQALEILKMLNPEERNRILKTINIKNPGLANDLSQNCSSPNDIQNFKSEDFLVIFSKVKPEILGLALKNTSQNFQRSILKLAPRQYAETAFSFLIMDLPLEKRETIVRAKKLILQELNANA